MQPLLAEEKQKVLHIVNMCVALGIQHAVGTIHIVICDLPGSTVFFRIVS